MSSLLTSDAKVQLLSDLLGIATGGTYRVEESIKNLTETAADLELLLSRVRATLVLQEQRKNSPAAPTSS